MYIVNAPSFFPMIWSLAKAFLSAETQRKIKILGASKAGQDEVVADLGAESLPEEYGGTCSCPGGCCPVPSGVAPWGSEPGAYDGEDEAEEETVQLTAGKSKEIELHLIGNGAVVAAEAGAAAPAAAAATEGDAAAAAPAPASPVVAVAAGEEAFWTVNVAAKDVDFSVEFRPASGSRRNSASDNKAEAVAAAAAAIGSLSLAASAAPVAVVPVTRLSSGDGPLQGFYAADQPGVLVFKLSNAHARWHGKTVTIRTGTRAKRG